MTVSGGNSSGRDSMVTTIRSMLARCLSCVAEIMRRSSEIIPLLTRQSWKGFMQLS